MVLILSYDHSYHEMLYVNYSSTIATIKTYG